VGGYPAHAVIRAIRSYGAAGKSDLRGDGSLVHASAWSYLSEEQKHEVRVFLHSLDLIPTSLLVQATSASANLEAMRHPCWIPYRKTASGLLKVLGSAAQRNRSYFSSL
jgi:hypothetical protein